MKPRLVIHAGLLAAALVVVVTEHTLAIMAALRDRHR